MSERERPSKIAGGCLCGSLRYTIDFPEVSSWPPEVTSCQCTKCRKWLSSLQGIALIIPLKDFSFPCSDSKDASQLRDFESSEDSKRAFCGNCGSGLTFRNSVHMPDTVEVFVGTLDEEYLIGKVKKGEESKSGQKQEREGGYGKQLAVVQETLFWNQRIEGVTDLSPSGKKWWGMIFDGESFE
ncbi:Mss4-like protein [Pyrenochaeta sp. MPI-SDFR-AT-0127]|nr:Mss4-like protein [Pyrenochaeta sp. MPI-SDFR-AT-0127]